MALRAAPSNWMMSPASIVLRMRSTVSSILAALILGAKNDIRSESVSREREESM